MAEVARWEGFDASHAGTGVCGFHRMLGVAAYGIWALGARRLSTALYNKDVMAVVAAVNFDRESALCGSLPYVSSSNLDV